MSVPPAADRRDEIRRLRAFLADVGFDAGGVGELLGGGDELPASTFDVAVHLRRLAAQPSLLATLVELFVLGAPVPRSRAEEHLAPVGLDVLRGLGLVEIGEDVHAIARIVPHDVLLIASDSANDQRSDRVAGVHRPSSTLAHLTLREPVPRALDVGTGNGVQALLLTAHAEHVVATDVNERALAFAAFNAALNGRENIEFRAGSLLEPVADDRFDLVVANPPYVVSPENAFLFRDSGLGRDRVSEDLVRALPGVLADVAFATVMVSWIEGGEDPPRPATWLGGSGCDAFVLHTRTEDALASAAAWNRDAPSGEVYRERLARWDYYRDEAIESLGYGAIVLRRRPGPNWIRALELPATRLSPAADHLTRLFAAQDFLAESPDLLAERFAFAPGVGLEQELDARDSGWVVRDTTLVASEGLGFRVGLDANTARIVTGIRPDRALASVLDAVAVAADPELVRKAGAGLVRKLLEFGLVVPARLR